MEDVIRKLPNLDIVIIDSSKTVDLSLSRVISEGRVIAYLPSEKMLSFTLPELAGARKRWGRMLERYLGKEIPYQHLIVLSNPQSSDPFFMSLFIQQTFPRISQNLIYHSRSSRPLVLSMYEISRLTGNSEVWTLCVQAIAAYIVSFVYSSPLLVSNFPPPLNFWLVVSDNDLFQLNSFSQLVKDGRIIAYYSPHVSHVSLSADLSFSKLFWWEKMIISFYLYLERMAISWVKRKLEKEMGKIASQKHLFLIALPPKPEHSEQTFSLTNSSYRLKTTNSIHLKLICSIMSQIYRIRSIIALSQLISTVSSLDIPS